MASTISQIREKYFCANCEGSCWISKTGHIKLSSMHLTTWARAIASIIFFFIRLFEFKIRLTFLFSYLLEGGGGKLNKQN
jgi:hypothetical protein